MHLTHSSSNHEENGSRLAVNNHRSKTGNKNTFKLLTSHVDIKCGLSDDINVDKIDCSNVNEQFLLANSPQANFCILSPMQSNVSISISPVSSSLLTTSKSENNIFDKNLTSESPSHFNVVSLSDLSDDAQYYANTTKESEHHYMNDLSKTQVLNRLPDDEINGKIANHF